MEHNEYEMQIEYSEMTTFNFNSKEYKEVLKDLDDCEKALNYFERVIQGILKLPTKLITGKC